MAINSRALVALSLAYTIMAATLAKADTCCPDYSDINGPGPSSYNTLGYIQFYTDKPPELDGEVAVGYKSPRCGACAIASFQLKRSASCKFDGSLPTIRAFKCTYTLGYISSGYTNTKEKRNNEPCIFNSDVSTSVNDTHYERCYKTYLGVASSEFSLSRPGAIGTISCKGLVEVASTAGVSTCDTLVKLI